MKAWMLLLALSMGGCANAPPPLAQTTTVGLRGQRFTVELALDDAQRQRGLMMRTSVAADHGMLFVFPHAGPQAFWMKNTWVPLDMLYFDEARRLVSVQADAQPCKADPCPLYPSEAPARYVLELAAGTAHRIGVQAGDVLEIEGALPAAR